MSAKMPQLSGEFKEFLYEAKLHGYGSAGVERIPTESGGSEIVYEDGDWHYTDNYIGGDPYIGYEHVSVRYPSGQEAWLPVWGMSYRGDIRHASFSGSMLESALSIALSQPQPDLPLRGPSRLELKESIYSFRVVDRGNLERFEAVEKIRNEQNSVLYIAKFVGGLANRQKLLELTSQRWIKNG